MSRFAVIALLLAVAGLAQANAGVQKQAVQHTALRTAGGPAKLPEQGYEGKEVRHQNMKSITSDFGSEYGPTTMAPPHAGAHGSTIAVAVAALALAAQAFF